MSDTNNLIEEAILLAGSLLQELTNNSDFDDKLKLAFGNNIETDLLKDNWIASNFIFPEIEIVNSSEINNANGAYAKATNKIYLAEEFLSVNRNNIGAIADVILEEYGHYIDSQLNDVDAPGDEGAIFVALVQGKELSESELQQLRSENDTAVVVLDGKNVAIEQDSTEQSITLFFEDFESDLSKWTGKQGESSSGIIVADPLQSDRSLSFTEFGNGGDIVTIDRFEHPNKKYRLSFDYLSIPVEGSIQNDMGGFAGYLYDLNNTLSSSQWLMGTSTNSLNVRSEFKEIDTLTGLKQF